MKGGKAKTGLSKQTEETYDSLETIAQIMIFFFVYFCRIIDYKCYIYRKDKLFLLMHFEVDE